MDLTEIISSFNLEDFFTNLEILKLKYNNSNSEVEKFVNNSINFIFSDSIKTSKEN